MQVYDLDKTQEWLNRTLAISKEPPIRGGVRTDHRARRQAAGGVVVVALAVLLFAGLSTREPAPAEVKRAAPNQATATEEAVATQASPSARPAPDDVASAMVIEKSFHSPFLDFMPQALAARRDQQGATIKVAPHAPIWLDGR